MSTDSGFQVVALSFNAFNATWTKFLHSEPKPFARDAMKSLLGESRREVAKLFETSGMVLPFGGDMVQTLTLRRGQRRLSNMDSSAKSEFEFVTTPGSSLSGEAVLEEVIPVEVVSQEAPSVIDPYTVDEAVAASEILVPEVDASAIEENVCDCEKPIILLDENPPALAQETQAEASSSDLGHQGFFVPLKKNMKKKKKKNSKKSRDEFVEPEPSQEDNGLPAECATKHARFEEPANLETLLESPEGVNNTISCWEIPNPVGEEPELAETVVSESNTEVVSLDTYSDYWGAFSSKKNKKKKKGKTIIDNLDSIVETSPLVDESFDASQVKLEEHERIQSELHPVREEYDPAPSTPPTNEVDDLSIFSANCKNTDVLVEPTPAQEPMVHDDEWAIPLGRVEKDLQAFESESKAKHNSPTTSSLPETGSPAPTGCVPQTQDALEGKTVVFTIRSDFRTDSRTLQVMMTLAANTRAAITNALNSYLDSKIPSSCEQVQRKLEIKSGAGKDGDVDFSTLDESMWPACLEYLGQHKKVLELTVGVVDY